MDSSMGSKKYSFDEYRMYYESAEKVTDRRISNNQRNDSFAIAVILAIALAWNWAFANPQYSYIIFSFTAILSLVAALFCSLWITQIRDFKSLNAAKFDVLDKMAPNVVFDSSIPGVEITSFNAFKEEWELMQQRKTLQRWRLYNIIGLKSSTLEFFVPNAFRILFVVTLVVSMGPSVLHWDQFLTEWQKLIGF